MQSHLRPCAVLLILRVLTSALSGAGTKARPAKKAARASDGAPTPDRKWTHTNSDGTKSARLRRRDN
jgi:hypothetical protein